MTRQWQKKRPSLPSGKSGLPASTSNESELSQKESRQDKDTGDTGEQIGMANRENTGALIHAYVRAKWLDKRDQSDFIRLGEQLGREVVQRLNALGFDAEELLEVPAEEALAKLQTLEDQARLEDAGIAGTGQRASSGRQSHMKSWPPVSRRQGRR